LLWKKNFRRAEENSVAVASNKLSWRAGAEIFAAAAAPLVAVGGGG
jgi:hypothetical protein